MVGQVRMNRVQSRDEELTGELEWIPRLVAGGCEQTSTCFRQMLSCGMISVEKQLIVVNHNDGTGPYVSFASSLRNENIRPAGQKSMTRRV